jgi:prepilin-type N-terminal cleavage/methylation domain-containing protein
MSRRLRDESGFTLMEMIVAMSIGMIVLLGLFSIVDSALPASNRIRDRVDAQAKGRTTLEQMVRKLRSAVCVQTSSDPSNPTFLTPFASGADSQVTFYADMTTSAAVQSGTFGPDKYQLVYDPTTKAITENVWTGTGTIPNMTWAGTPTTRVLATNIEPLAGQPMFTYWEYDTTVVPPILKKILLQVPGGGGAPVVPDADLARIAKIDLGIVAKPTTKDKYSGTQATFEDSASVRIGSDFNNPNNAPYGPRCRF